MEKQITDLKLMLDRKNSQLKELTKDLFCPKTRTRYYLTYKTARQQNLTVSGAKKEDNKTVEYQRNYKSTSVDRRIKK